MTVLATGCGDLEATPPAPSPPNIPAPRDAATESTAVQLVVNPGLTILGVTEGGSIIYEDASFATWAVGFTGGHPVQISPTAAPASGIVGYQINSFVQNHIVVMSVVGDPNGGSPAASTPVSVWDDRTKVTTTLAPPAALEDAIGWGLVSADSQYIELYWQSFMGSGTASTISKVDGTGLVNLLDGGYGATFDGDELVAAAIAGTPGQPVSVRSRANGWSSTTLATDAPLFAVDAIGARALVAEGPVPNGGQGVSLVPLDGGAHVLVDPTGGGPLVYLSPDSTLAVYTAEAGTPNAYEAAVSLPLSGPPGTPYAIPAHAITAAGGPSNIEPNPFLVAPDAPTGPVGFFLYVPPTSDQNGMVSLVGLGEGAISPDLSLPYYFGLDGFTSDASHALLARPSASSAMLESAKGGTLSVYSLPDGPESAALSTTSLGWKALDGTTVLFTDHSDYGTADVRICDVAKGTESTLVASGTTGYAVSPDHTMLAYTTNEGLPMTGGLWVVKIPAAP